MDKSVKKLTEPQREIFQQFKENIADLVNSNETDTYLLKWLRTRNFNLRRAETYYREMKSIRKLYCFDTICETYVKPEVAQKYEYTAFLGYAKDGSIVRYNAVGKGDHYGFIMSLTPFHVALYPSFLLEEDHNLQRMQNKLNGENVHEITYIFDLAGLVLQDIMHKCVYEIALDLMHIVQDIYPECWGNIFVINTPPYFDKLFNLFKPILRMNLLERLQLVSRDSIGSVLLKYIDEDVLPVFLGGKRVDSLGDPKCAEFLRFGGKVPTSYYLRSRPPLLPTDPGVISKWVAARSIYNHPVMVKKANSTIKMQLRTENGSIHLSIYYRKFRQNEGNDVPGEEEYVDEQIEECPVRKVSPGMRLQTHLAPVDDSNLAPWPGVYIFRFNNSHNWLYARRLIFRIRVVENDDS